ncbi:MAG: FAD-dependent oxidoreductase, partial [Deltaproteobacteria bacterium]|nr:FAD-dependent oxidoreductase [Deltaproteobacteria bacterium]
MLLDVVVPEVSDGVTSGTVISVTVVVGEKVEEDQTLLELETDKAVVAIPSPRPGKITEIRVAEGDTAEVGAVIVVLETTEQGTADEVQPLNAATEESAEVPDAQPSEAAELVVIGAGPGGYAAAFKAAELGLKVTLIDPEVNPGGVCLHRGCIPSKALLHVAKLVSEAEESAAIGVSFAKPTIDIERVRSWKDEVIGKLTAGLGSKVQKMNIAYVRGTAQFKDAQTLLVTGVDGGLEEMQFEKAILATGSRPIMLPGVDPASDKIIDSTGALELVDVPKSLLVVGGGYIGLELGSAYAALGSKVSVVEMTDGLLPGCDRDLVS